MASNSASWMPAQGRRPVNVGSSLNRALKARKGNAPAPKRNNLPEREFYSFRYSFKPESTDTSKPGSMELQRGKDLTTGTVDHPSVQPGESLRYRLSERPAKEWECVLIYDEETGQFTLEKLDSYMKLDYDRRVPTTQRLPSASPLPPASSAAASKPTDARLNLDLDLDADVEGELEEEDGEILPSPKVARKTEKKQEVEEGMIPSPSSAGRGPPRKDNPPQRRQPPPPTNTPASKVAALPPKPAPVPAKAVVPLSNPPTTAAPAPKPKPKLAADGGNAKVKREHPASLPNADGEDLEFDKSVRQAKRPRPSPPATELALPGPSTGISGPKLDVQPATPPVAPASDDDDDDYWDEVSAHSVAEPAASRDRDEDEGHELDEDAFALEMDMALGNDNDNDDADADADVDVDDDFLAAAVSPEPEVPKGRPMSLNQYAGGDPAGDMDDDDYSSSEEDSEED